MTGKGAFRRRQRLAAISAAACGIVVGVTIVGVAIIGRAAAQSADPIPPEWLQQQHDIYVESCLRRGTQVAICEQEGTCMVTEESATISRDEYAVISNAAASGQSIPPDLKEKLLTISDRCKAD